MSLVLIGVLVFALMIVLVLFSINVAYAIMICGLLGLVMVMGLEPALASIASIAYDRATDYTFATIPLFMLMASFIAFTDIGGQSYAMCRAWIGHLRGGLAMATVGACGIFAACTGTSMAGAIAMGKIAYPEMKRYGYEAKLSLGTIAAGATLGILIPPSMGFILVGILTQISIGKLFIAGILPGLLQIVLYVILITLICRVKPNWGPAGPKATWKERASSLGGTWAVLLLFVLIMGGMYGGIFSATEAGAIGAFGAFVIALAKKQMNRKNFFASLLDSAQVTGFIFALVTAAFVFKQFLAVTRIPFEFSAFIADAGINKYLIVGILVIVYIIMGMIFDIYAIILMTVPVIFPTMQVLGFDPIWFGVVMVKMMEMGDYTPPFGFNLFALAGTLPGVKITDLYYGIIPFFISDLIHLVLLIAFPIISTLLPNLMIHGG